MLLLIHKETFGRQQNEEWHVDAWLGVELVTEVYKLMCSLTPKEH